MEAIKVLAKILANILTALYEPFGFSLLLSFFAMKELMGSDPLKFYKVGKQKEKICIC